MIDLVSNYRCVGQSRENVAKSALSRTDREMATVVYGFMNPEERDNHFLDHNREFEPEFASGEAYEAAAIAFLTCELSNTMLECVRRNGDRIRFNQATDEFAICAFDGRLKTYYKPDVYWHRQESNLAYFKGQCAK